MSQFSFKITIVLIYLPITSLFKNNYYFFSWLLRLTVPSLQILFWFTAQSCFRKEDCVLNKNKRLFVVHLEQPCHNDLIPLVVTLTLLGRA